MSVNACLLHHSRLKWSLPADLEPGLKLPGIYVFCCPRLQPLDHLSHGVGHITDGAGVSTLVRRYAYLLGRASPPLRLQRCWSCTGDQDRASGGHQSSRPRH